jgi:hypothetical protein
MAEVTWVVQANLGCSSDVDSIGQACAERGMTCVPVAAIPFDPDLPEALVRVPATGPVIIYGATGFVTRVHEARRWTPGVFFDSWRFTVPVWQAAWGPRCLNDGADITTISEFSQRRLPDDREFFIRPVRDLKEFVGSVVRFGNFTTWFQRISHGEYTVTADCPIVVADPVNIDIEWRLFMVDGKVSSGSRYRLRGYLFPNSEVPSEVVEFAEGTAAIWSPAPVFVLDVGRSAGRLFVVECGCFNSAGFYASDIPKIVEDVSSYARRPG